MNLKRLYFYFAIIIYNTLEKLPESFWSRDKAFIILMWFEIAAIYSISLGAELIFSTTIHGLIPIIPSVAIIFYNIYIDSFKDIWQKYLNEFHSEELKIRKLHAKILLITILAIISSFILVIYLKMKLRQNL